MKSLFERSRAGRRAWSLPGLDVPAVEPAEAFGDQVRADNDLPELSEIDIARHYVGLSTLNHHVDRGFYPLGSCTMKYNPKVNERAARLPGLADLHPHAPEEACQGALQLMYELGEYLKEISGMDAVTLQPAAGAHGELCGMMMVRRHFEERGEQHRVEVLVPDSAHGTNPASVTLAGFKSVQVKSNARGEVDPAELDRQCTDCVACLMEPSRELGRGVRDLAGVAPVGPSHVHVAELEPSIAVHSLGVGDGISGGRDVGSERVPVDQGRFATGRRDR
ncbi:MAG: hypothetical protein R6X14_00470, partial [bacterium]